MLQQPGHSSFEATPSGVHLRITEIERAYRSKSHDHVLAGKYKRMEQNVSLRIV